MLSKKVTYKSKTRNDISNPFNKHSHEELLRLADVQDFKGSFDVQQLKNGRIKVKKIDKDFKKEK